MGNPDQPSGQGQPSYPVGEPGSGYQGYPQPGYGQNLPGYGVGGYQQMTGGYQSDKTSGLAIAALACGIGQILIGVFAGIPAIILGHLARRRIRQTGERGAGIALAGLILGYVGVALVIILIIVVAAAAAHNS